MKTNVAREDRKPKNESSGYFLSLTQGHHEIFGDWARQQDADMAVIADNRDRGPFIEVEGAEE